MDCYYNWAGEASQPGLLPPDDILPCLDPPEPVEIPETVVAAAEPKPKRRRRTAQEEVEVLASGTVPLPSVDDMSRRRKKRKRVPEFDPHSGEWIDVRRFDRMPVTIEKAEQGEKASKVPHGAYFVSLAYKRISGIIQLHDRWLKKTKNQCSDYAEVQRDLMNFFSDMLHQFYQRYAMYTTHPQFESIGRTRKRQASPPKKI